jgi:hypothetical protein
MDEKNPSSDDMRRCPPLLNWTILSRSQEMVLGLNLEHVALTFVVASTRTWAPRAASAPALAPARRPFAAPLPFSAPLLLLLF